jgi:hypothetical protein
VRPLVVTIPAHRGGPAVNEARRGVVVPDILAVAVGRPGSGHTRCSVASHTSRLRV